MEKKVVISCDYSEIDELAQRFNEKWEFLCAAEASNGISKEYSLDGKMDEYDFNNWNDFLNGKDSNNDYVVMQGLCHLGLLEPGEYVVDCSW